MRFDAIAIVGARGTLGEQILEQLAAIETLPRKVHLLASGDSVGETLSFGQRELDLKDADAFEFTAGCLVVVFADDQAPAATRAQINRDLIERALSAGAFVIDASGAALRDDLPMWVADHAGSLPLNHSQAPLVAIPSGLSVALTRVLRPIAQRSGIARLTVSTYQSVSASGAAAVEELGRQTVDMLNFREPEVRILPRRMAFNVLPKVGEWGDDERTTEEQRIADELTQLLGIAPSVIDVTCAQVPMFYGFAATVRVDTESYLGEDDALNGWQQADDVHVLAVADLMATPADAVASHQLQISRVRRDRSHAHGVSFWIAGDELHLIAENAVHALRQILASTAADDPAD